MAGRVRLWAVVGAALGFLIFYVLVMPGIIKKLAAGYLAKGYPGLTVNIGSAMPSLPAGVRFGGISLKDQGGRSFEAAKLAINARVFKLLGGSLSFAVDSALYGGRLKGVIDYPGMSVASGPFKANFSFEGLKAGDCSLLKLGRQLTGKMSGSVELAGEAGSASRGNGRIDLVILNGILPLADNSMGLQGLAFERLEFSAVLNQGILKISRFDLTDRALAGSFQGHMLLGNGDFGRNQLWLQGHLTLSSDPGRRHTVILSGTFEQPAVDIL